MHKKLFFITAIIVVSSAYIFGSGFQINEHGARAMAMGGAFIGLADDPSAVHFNPAGLSFQSGTSIVAGFTFIKPNSTFRGPSPAITEYKLKDQFFNPINFYVSHSLNKDMAIGLGVNNPYGLGTRWEPDWIGRFLAVDTEIATFFFTPVFSYKITDNLSIGAGPVIAYGDVSIIRYQQLPYFTEEPKIDLSGDGTGFGFNAGILYKPVKEISLGLSYRSEVELDFAGDATVEAIDEVISLLPSGSIKAPLTTPQNITFGVAVFPMEELIITADFQYVGWSSYDKLEVTFEDVIDETTGENYISSSVRDYENSYIARLGAEYKMCEKMDIRGGLFYDNNPVKEEYAEPTLPDADRLGLNIGLGYQLTPCFTLDLSYLYLRFNEREITESENNYMEGVSPFTGVYNSHAHLIGFNISYKF